VATFFFHFVLDLQLVSFSVMSVPQRSAPILPKETLASLPPMHISVISALARDLPILDTIIPPESRDLSEWHSNLRETVDWAYIKKLSVPPVPFVSKLKVFVDQWGWKGSIRYAHTSHEDPPLLPLWVLQYWSTAAEAITIRSRWKKALDWMGVIHTRGTQGTKMIFPPW
jgi:hypothetical protein